MCSKWPFKGFPLRAAMMGFVLVWVVSLCGCERALPRFFLPGNRPGTLLDGGCPYLGAG